MTPSQLRQAGEALYGERWKSPLAATLGVTYRTVLRWYQGEWPIPDGAAREIQQMLGRLRAEQALAKIDQLMAERGAPVEIALASPLVEAEVVRRRLPALVSDARHEDRVARYLVDHLQFDDYVVAPVTAGSAVIALLHADHPTSGLPLTTVHRDLLRMFADGVGLSYEKAMLLERIERQRRCVLDTCEAAALSVARAEASAPTPLRPPTLHPTSLLPKPIRIGSVSSAQSEAPSRRESRLATLTSREREVLALLASGATNAQLADRLTVAESTVKNNLSALFQKIGVRDRTQAVLYAFQEGLVTRPMSHVP